MWNHYYTVSSEHSFYSMCVCIKFSIGKKSNLLEKQFHCTLLLYRGLVISKGLLVLRFFSTKQPSNQNGLARRCKLFAKLNCRFQFLDWVLTQWDRSVELVFWQLFDAALFFLKDSGWIVEARSRGNTQRVPVETVLSIENRNHKFVITRWAKRVLADTSSCHQNTLIPSYVKSQTQVFRVSLN